jgi:23S rRNA pseudouridine2604 synthase
MRINKYLAESGVASRRQADEWIATGRVTINGEQAQLGTVVSDGDEICVDGKMLRDKPTKIYIALNKPVGITCTTEPSVRGNIVDFVNHSQRIFPIGRLDKDSEGLILLTNDGDIVNSILRAEQRKEKEYLVTVDRDLTEACIRGLASGVKILGRMTLPCEVEQLAPSMFRIILTQGMNRQIRRMCEAWGYNVKRLRRIRIMHIQLGDLSVGKWRPLTTKELTEMFAVLKKPQALGKIKKNETINKAKQERWGRT